MGKRKIKILRTRLDTMGEKKEMNTIIAAASKQLRKWFSISRLAQSSWEDKLDSYTGFVPSHAYRQYTLGKLFLNGLTLKCTYRCRSHLN